MAVKPENIGDLPLEWLQLNHIAFPSWSSGTSAPMKYMFVSGYVVQKIMGGATPHQPEIAAYGIRKI